jgi:hypothetical protein
MPANINFTFYLMNGWTLDDLSLREGNNLDSNHNIIKVYSFNSDMGNWHLPLHELDFSHFYFHWNLSSA